MMLDSCSSSGIYLSLNAETYGYIYWCEPTHEGEYIYLSDILENFLNRFETNPDYPQDKKEFLTYPF